MTPDDLADRLRETGALTEPEWDAAVRAVPRHVFVPRFVEQRADLTWRTVSGDDRRDEWLAAVYADRALVTALRADARGRPEPVSSSSAPGLMVRMLETLELCDGHRVLEIGTGAGYNAGLLAHRLGSENVASVDVEATLVDAARDRLAELGRHPALAVTDGVLGLPERAPYDRIVATCAVPRVPPAWLDQLAPDGRVLTDLTIAGGAGNLVDLRATSSGLEGRFLARWAGFMGLRHTGDAAPRAERRERALRRTTDAPTARPWWDDQVVWFLAALHLSDDVVTGVRMNDRYEPVATTMKAADGSWADVEIEPDAAGRRAVRGSTPDLWRAVEDAYDLWRRLDRPGWDRLGLTVGSADEQHVWIDDPGGDHVWPLP